MAARPLRFSLLTLSPSCRRDPPARFRSRRARKPNSRSPLPRQVPTAPTSRTRAPRFQNSRPIVPSSYAWKSMLRSRHRFPVRATRWERVTAEGKTRDDVLWFAATRSRSSFQVADAQLRGRIAQHDVVAGVVPGDGHLRLCAVGRVPGPGRRILALRHRQLRRSRTPHNA
jgi:hypothetical protein